MSEKCEKLYNWQLIEFIEYSTTEHVPYVDCVPSTWITYNPSEKEMLTHYPAQNGF